MTTFMGIESILMMKMMNVSVRMYILSGGAYLLETGHSLVLDANEFGLHN